MVALVVVQSFCGCVVGCMVVLLVVCLFCGCFGVCAGSFWSLIGCFVVVVIMLAVLFWWLSNTLTDVTSDCSLYFDCCSPIFGRYGLDSSEDLVSGPRGSILGPAVGFGGGPDVELSILNPPSPSPVS